MKPTMEDFLINVSEFLDKELGIQVQYMSDVNGICFGTFMLTEQEVKKKYIPWMVHQYFDEVTPFWSSKVDDKMELVELYKLIVS